jgi:hypothetical protein
MVMFPLALTLFVHPNSGDSGGSGCDALEFSVYKPLWVLWQEQLLQGSQHISFRQRVPPVLQAQGLKSTLYSAFIQADL